MDDARLGGRLPLLPPDRLQPDARALYDRLVSGRLDAPFQTRTDDGALIGPFNALLHAPGIGQGFVDLHQAEGRATPLSPRLREVVILSIGAIWDAAYELYAHRHLAARAGLSHEVVAALAAGEASDQLSAEERAAQRFTLLLARDRRVDAAAYAAAEAALGRDRLVAVVLLVAIYSATSVMLNAFEVPAPAQDDPRSTGAEAD